jgi:hypothetical protein
MQGNHTVPAHPGRMPCEYVIMRLVREHRGLHLHSWPVESQVWQRARPSAGGIWSWTRIDSKQQQGKKKEHPS